MRTAIAGLGLLLVLQSFAAAPAAAATASRVVVVDASGTPVAGAQIVALAGGRTTTLGQTDAAGVALVTLEGRQTLSARLGRRNSPPVSSDAQTIRLVMPLLEIAQVHARTTTSPNRTVSRNSESVVAFDDVATARSLLPNYRSRAEGGSGSEMLNGVPLQLPADPHARGGGAEPGVPSDLIESFSATQADDGTVTPNYHVLTPDGTRTLRLTSGLGVSDDAMLKLALSNTIKKFGYALVAASGRDDGALAHQTLLDSSGASYDHSTATRRLDTSVSLSYQLGTTQINAVGIGSHRQGRAIDDALPGALPQGFGPDADATRDSRFEYVIAAQSHGRDSYHLLDARYAGGADQDVRDGAGFRSGYAFSGYYDELAWSRSFGRDVLTAKATATATSTLGYAGPAGALATTVARAGEQTLGLRFERNDGQRGFGLGADVLHRNGAFAGTALEARANARTVVGPYALALTALHQQAQTLEAYGAGAYQLSPPASAAYDCTAGAATVTAPAQVGGVHPHSDTLTATVKRNFRSGATVTAGGFVSEGRDMLVDPVSSLGVAVDPGYVSALQRTYAGLCGGAQLAGERIFMQQYQTVPRLRGREFYLDGVLPLGALRGELTYETYSLAAPVVPAVPAGTVSSLVAGGQLAGIPLHRANLLLSYRHGGVVYASALQYVGGNNAQNLPGYLRATFGAQAPLGPGVLSGSVENALGAYAGAFTSPRWAVGLASNGAPIPTLAVPLRTVWRLHYTLPLGAPRASHS
jgi:hypothetical protein